jgi:carboxypeptidase Q
MHGRPVSGLLLRSDRTLIPLEGVMKLLRSVVILVFTTSSSLLFAAPNRELQEGANQLTASIYTGPVMRTLQELSDGFGGRLTGSTSYNQAAEWAAGKFRSYGIKNVKLEPFAMDNGWARGTAHGQLLSPVSRALHLESLGWSPSTPAGGANGEVIIVDDISADAVKAMAPKVKNKIVIIDVNKIFANGWVKVLQPLEESYKVFKENGAVALIFPSGDRNNVLSASDPNWGSSLLLMPGAQIGMEDFKLIRRSLENGPVTMQFELQNATSGSMQVNNVVAEIRGSELPDEWIIIGAHLDSWDYGTGAQDNGSGSAMVLEVARAIAAIGKAPRRSIRFALWGGEEQGLLGSYAYTQAHLNEISKCVAVLNTDNGAGHPKGWKVEDRKDLQDAMKPISDGLLKDIGGGGLSLETTYDTDHGPFMLQGVPALDLWVDMSHYGEVRHKSSDTFDKIDPVDLKAGAAILAVTAWAIAEDSKPIAGHLDHAAVAVMLKKIDLEPLLTFIGQWKP